MNFQEIQNGCKEVLAQTEKCQEEFQAGDVDDAAAISRQLVRDIQVLLKQATELEGDLVVMQSDIHRLLKNGY